ncbi:MAG: tRNA threonylcarbamoyladenosine biosynthesis protein TsaE, partial [Mycobacterium sp.]|nr:tRNA threonylcarbamoyladenosine biosynthesis protein TsaE [Mycobacterium sp.]
MVEHQTGHHGGDPLGPAPPRLRSPRTLERVEDTVALGSRLGEQLRAGDVVVLSGPLGAGKTVLAKGIAVAMDVEGPVTSPTYVLARVHRARQA